MISLSMALWSGDLPRPTARVSWLRWILEWDLEESADDKLNVN